MAIREFLVIFAVTTLVCSIETDDIEHKKRGAGKTTGVNTIPTGIQKPDYTYTIYSQNPNTVQQSSVPSQSYHAQIPNSFYPSQTSSQYYSPSSSTNEGAHSNPQVNAPQQQTTQQFVPLNFIPNSGYQAKYQIVPSKSANGNIQLALIQPAAGFPNQNIQVPQTVYSQPANQVNTNANPLLTSVSPHGQFNFHPSYQPLSLGSPYLGHASTVLFPQFNHPFYNSLLYSTPGQNFYYPANSQSKHSYSQSAQPPSSNEHQKVQSTVPISSTKEDNDIAAQNSDSIHGDYIPGYKNGYTSSRSTAYTKIK